jgi:hypothetical protein
MQNMREAMRDDRSHTIAARVQKHEGESKHYEVNAEGDLIVSVVGVLSGTPIWANLGALCGGNGKGVWVIPDEGVEVIVAFDDGDFEGEAYIIGMHPSGSTPAGMIPGRVYIYGVEVLIGNGSGGEEPLITKTQFDAHVHPTGTGPSGTPTNAATSGTTVLKGK